MYSVHRQLERLKRHYDSAVQTYDPISLLDLSHALRLWVELKGPLLTLAPKFASAISFKTAIPAKKVLNAARGHKYVFSYMPGKVRTYASNGHIASGPGMGPGDGDFCIAAIVKLSPPLIEMGNFCFVSTSFDPPILNALQAERVTRCTYGQWLAAEAVRMAYVSAEGKLEKTTISREMIIKRIANTLDGSHPSVAESGTTNIFDVPVHYLLAYKVGGLPLPYFILLKIAQDILDIAPKFLSVEAQ